MAINLTITEENEPPISVTITEGIGVTTGGGSTTVIDNLTSTSATSALSANQGRVLDEGKAAIDHNHDGEYDPSGSAATVQSNLTTHENDTTNPHNVSASQVGLSNVENTALSTWTGNTSITSLGTISVGTWQGTAIADAYIASAATWNAKAPTANPTITGTASFQNIGFTGDLIGGDLVQADAGAFDDLTLTNALPVIQGGTGATTATGARTNLDAAKASVVTDYIGSAATIISSAGVATPNAASGRSQKFPLTENVTLFNVPINLADGQSMLITVLQDTTPRSMSFDVGYTLMGSGVAADIVALTSGQYAWLTISRYGTDYLLAINTEP